ncbi:MAG TPA: energy-coupling factor transporter transmembrane component T [Methanoregulaceae archaeon]|nr:energy-coupling factor transporter transmembrane component T [Methanoregulaceae archaeon]
MTEILQYVQKEGIFHRLTPLTKIILVVAAGAISILATNILFLLLVLLVLLVLAYAGRLHREVIQQFALIAVMSVIIILVTVVTLPGGEVLGYLVPEWVPFIGGSIPITTGGLVTGVIMTLRFAVLICAIQLFVLSTQPRDLVHTLERMKVPIDYTLMFVIALRFIPTLQIEAVRIHEAQLARGYDPGTGVGGKIRSLAPVMIPLVSNSLARSNVLGLTIDLRGYRTRKRTPLRERHLKSLDYGVIVIVLFCLISFVCLKFQGSAWIG